MNDQTRPDQGPTTPAPQGVAFPTLVAELRRAVDLFDAMARVNMPHTVPPELVELCERVIEHGAPSGPDRRAIERAALRHAPLRQMIWQVVPIGKEFTVREAKEGLERLGIDAESDAVSNVLGHIARNGRMHRVRKGRYIVPPPPPSAEREC